MRRIFGLALRCLAIVLMVSVGGCASKPEAPSHYASLEDYLIANHRDITTYYRHADPDKLMQCYAQSATLDIPPAVKPDLLVAANKAAAGQPLTAAEQDLKTKWLDSRPRPEDGGDVLNVETPRALDIVRTMAVTCFGVRLN